MRYPHHFEYDLFSKLLNGEKLSPYEFYDFFRNLVNLTPNIVENIIFTLRLNDTEYHLKRDYHTPNNIGYDECTKILSYKDNKYTLEYIQSMIDSHIEFLGDDVKFDRYMEWKAYFGYKGTNTVYELFICHDCDYVNFGKKVKRKFIEYVVKE